MVGSFPPLVPERGDSCTRLAGEDRDGKCSPVGKSRISIIRVRFNRTSAATGLSELLSLTTSYKRGRLPDRLPPPRRTAPRSISRVTPIIHSVVAELCR